MLIRINLFKDRVFIYAVIASLVWHIFWLSIVKIVAPQQALPIKFSKVSFLGPILTRGAIDLRMQPTLRSLLEVRYFESLAKLPASRDSLMRKQDVGYDSKTAYDTKLVAFIDEAVSGAKMEPRDAGE